MMIAGGRVVPKTFHTRLAQIKGFVSRAFRLQTHQKLFEALGQEF